MQMQTAGFVLARSHCSIDVIISLSRAYVTQKTRANFAIRRPKNLKTEAWNVDTVFFQASLSIILH